MAGWKDSGEISTFTKEVGYVCPFFVNSLSIFVREISTFTKEVYERIKNNILFPVPTCIHL